MSRRNPYIEIALTYLRRKMFWLAAGLYAPVLAGLVCTLSGVAVIGFSPPAKGRSISLVVVLFGVAYFAGSIGVHVKQQIANARSALAPHHRYRHLVVAGVLLLITGFAVPLTWSWALGLSLLGTAAFMATFVALVLWWAHTMSMILYALLLPAWFALITPPGMAAASALLLGEATPTAVALLTAGMLGLTALALRAYGLDEEHWEYYRQLHAGGWDWRSRMTGRHPEIWRAFARGPLLSMFEPSERQLARATGASGRSLWARVTRRRLGLTLGKATWVSVVGVFLLMMLVVPMWRLSQPRIVLMTWLVVMPACFISRRVRTCKLTLGQELLRPATRRTWLIETALALLVELLQMWLAVAVAFVAAALVWWPDLLRSVDGWLMLALTLAAQATIWGLGAWLLRYRSAAIPWLALAAVVGLCVLVAVAWSTRQFLGPTYLAGAALLFVLVGVVLVADAYRRWLRTDLD